MTQPCERQAANLRRTALALSFIAAMCPADSATATFEAVYGGPLADGLRYVEPTTDGGFIACGYRTISPDSTWDVWVIKTDGEGDTLWTTIFGSPLNDHALCVRETSDGCYALGGAWSSELRHQDAAGALFLALLDAQGDSLWTWRFAGGDTAAHGGVNFVLEDTDGHFVFAGTRREYGFHKKHACMMKINRDTRAEIWQHLYPADLDRHTWGCAVRKTPADGGFVMTGLYEEGPQGESVYLVKTDGDGDTLWTRRLADFGDFEGRHLALTSDGGYVITGNCNLLPDTTLRAFVLKADAQGGQTWVRTYGPVTWNSAGWAVEQLWNDDFIVTGYAIAYATSSRDLFLLRTDSTGDSLWARSYGLAHGIPYTDTGYSLAALHDGFIVAGLTTLEAGGAEAYLLRTDENGLTSGAPPGTPAGVAREITLLPNPAARTVCIRLGAGWARETVLTIHDPTGRRLRRVAAATGAAFEGALIIWDGADESGREVSAGVYYVTAGDRGGSRSMPVTLVR